MRTGLRVLVAVGVLATAVSVVPGRLVTVSASDEIRLQLADLLLAEGRYAEAIDTYQQVKAAPAVPVRARALSGLVTSMLRVAEFEPALREATELRLLVPGDAAAMSLYGDAVWASGLFLEAEDA